MAEDAPGGSSDSGQFPEAEVARTGAANLARALRQHPSKLWLLTAVCLIVAVALMLSRTGSRGPRLTVTFAQGHGIKEGDPVRHRGIDVGQVAAVELDDQLAGVRVVIDLLPAAAGLARQGSRFWIARPQVSLSRISGLETVVGAKYVGVISSGDPAAPRKVEFEGDEAPLTMLESNVDIQIRFKDGQGLAMGDALRYRGIVVGEVTAVELSGDLSGVTVGVRLVENARRLARAGSQFWVERPEISLSGVRGLETLVGGRYLAVIPGPPDAEAVDVFDGLEQPPSTQERTTGGLDIVLEAKQREGLEREAPIMYRGVQVGHIISVGLSPDATQVEARAYVRPAYRGLVRENTTFWDISGINANLGVGGLDFHADTLATIAAGGIAMATPDPPGRQAGAGARFDVGEEPDGWIDWTPRIPIGAALLPAGATLPQPVRVALQWKERFLGISHTEQRVGWALVIEDQRLLAPADLLTPGASAVGNQATLQLEGGSATLAADAAQPAGALRLWAIRGIDVPLPDAWPRERIRAPAEPEDCLIVGGTSDRVLSLPASRVQPAEGGWTIEPSFTLTADAHGACLVSQRDGRLVGMIVIEKGKPRVAFAAEAQ